MRPFYLSSLWYTLCRKWSAAFFDSLRRSALRGAFFMGRLRPQPFYAMIS